MSAASSFLSLLSEFEIEGTNFPLDFLRHLSYSFVTILSQEQVIDLLQKTRLSIAIGDKEVSQVGKIIVISGNLEDYRNTILNLSSPLTLTHLRKVFNDILLFLEREGYNGLFPEHYKMTLRDQTFALVKT